MTDKLAMMVAVGCPVMPHLFCTLSQEFGYWEYPRMSLVRAFLALEYTPSTRQTLAMAVALI